MKSLLAALLLVAVTPLVAQSAAAPSRAPVPPTSQALPAGALLAQGIRIPLFDRSFPFPSCEFKCQDERDKCFARAGNRNDERECRLDYSLCSNDCDLYRNER